MAIEEDIRTHLLTLSAVTALVGTGATARIRPNKLEQDDNGAIEHIIIEVDDETPANSLDGLGGLIYSDVTLRCQAPTLKRARALAEAVRTNNTNPGTGLAGCSVTVNGHVMDAVLEDQQIGEDQNDDGSGNGTHIVFANYQLSETETT